MEHVDFGEETDVPSASAAAKKVLGPISRAFKGNSEKVEWDESDVYDFSHQSRGVALIISNNRFQNEASRQGSEHDKVNMEKIFRHLEFQDIRHLADLTSKDMFVRLQSVAKENHKNADCLVCAISSHGDEHLFNTSLKGFKRREDIILCADGAVMTGAIINLFNDVSCPTLKGKPRLFFIQCCRGKNLDSGVTIPEEGDNLDGDLEQPPTVLTPAPCFKDFLVMYSTPPGFGAMRRPWEGSWFIKALGDVILKSDPDKIEFNHLLTKTMRNVAVNYQSASANPQIGHDKKQAPVIYSMLTKDLFFTSIKDREKNPEPLQ